MKKLVLFVLATVGLLFVSDFVYTTYKRHQRTVSIGDDRAVIFVYFNITQDEMVEYFQLPDSLHPYIEEQYHVACVVPGSEFLYLINNRVCEDLSMINCLEQYISTRSL